MKLALIFSLFSFYSCSQELDISYNIKKKKVQFISELGKMGYILAPNSYLYFVIEKPDQTTGEWLCYLEFKGEKTKKIDQVDLSEGLYSYKLLFYESDKTEKQIILWKQEGEYFSYLYFYLFENGRLKNLGDICVGQACNGCDAHNYPEEQILVTSNQNKIQIRFKGKSIYRGSYLLNTPYHSEYIETEKLKLVFYDGNKASIEY